MQRAVDWLIYFAGAADKIQGEQIPFKPDALAYTRREPVGVVGAILPWNSPILLYAWKIGPALAAGNAMVLKPAEQTPVTALEIAKLVQEAGFPPGVFNVVPGYGATAGAALAKHTGREQDVVHRQLRHGAEDHGARLRQSEALHLRMRRQVASHRLRRCRCRARAHRRPCIPPFVRRANPARSARACSCSGRSTTSSSRSSPRARAASASASRSTRRPHIGPQTSAEQLAKTESYIALGKKEGARLIAGGARPKGFDRGYYIEPTVFADVDNRSRLAQEEIFGPVLAAIPFDTEEEVVRLANDVDYGLVAGLWTSDVSRAHRVAGQLEAGLVTVNTFRSTHWMLPYGGYKLSGIGRENGLEALNAFTELKTIVIDFETAAAARSVRRLTRDRPIAAFSCRALAR